MVACLWSLALLATLVAVSSQQSVKIGVYYEATKQTSIDFIRRQLYPTFLTLNERSVGGTSFKVDLIPYVEAQTESLMITKCQETRFERQACLTGKIHACAVENIEDQWRRLNFIHCLIVDGYASAPNCAVMTCVDDSPLLNCVNSVDGDVLMVNNYNKSVQLKLPTSTLNFPVVTLNGVFKAEEQYMTRLNLLATVCDKFAARFAGHCDSWRAKRTMTHDNFATNYFYPEKRKCSY